MGKRGVRRFLTLARKGTRHYGSKKVRRKQRYTAQGITELQISDTASVTETGKEEVECDFLGFEDARPQSTLPGSVCRPIIVLSLFDGISAGLTSLKNLGIPIRRYFSSEICPYALRVQSLRHPDIIRLGDVRDITPDVLDSLGAVDVLLGGSPCSDLSRVNPRRAGLFGGAGVLYFEFVRILRYLQQKFANTDHSIYWLYENTCHMDSCTLKEIKRDLGEPVIRCASMYLPVKRRRFFWGNVPHLHESSGSQAAMILEECIDSNITALITRARTLTSNRSAQGQFPVAYEDSPEPFSATDYERLQGEPWLEELPLFNTFHVNVQSWK
ncbi:DNA (cytosine-5)-methyltransferase 3A [Frankliniella fusca]|uniref:DNA (cytosine-5-)-methyltransferase n=1 Tax=Frankliniella fusca TaxID=407009 RepID=A0AAE1HBJ3_9NEOP|nr:DNA (cytosine-5)-methyltransferase 3A [Frankliniella fusca]